MRPTESGRLYGGRLDSRITAPECFCPLEGDALWSLFLIGGAGRSWIAMLSDTGGTMAWCRLDGSRHVCRSQPEKAVGSQSVPRCRTCFWVRWRFVSSEFALAPEDFLEDFFAGNPLWRSVDGPGSLTFFGTYRPVEHGYGYDMMVLCERPVSDVVVDSPFSSSFLSRFGSFDASTWWSLKIAPFPCRNASVYDQCLEVKKRQYAREAGAHSNTVMVSRSVGL
jgi:hypothetical protein